MTHVSFSLRTENIIEFIKIFMIIFIILKRNQCQSGRFCFLSLFFPSYGGVCVCVQMIYGTFIN